jgi:hypothetical protein
MPAPSTKCLPLYLGRDLYERLEREARQHDRDPIQQARWIIRQALTEPTVADEANRAPEQPAVEPLP